ncbi:MAG: pyruvate kinase, partial [Candidatus Brocadiia bacterium]
RIRTVLLKGHEPVRLERGAELTLRVVEFEGDAREIAISYERLPDDVAPGDRIMLSDGMIELEVAATGKGKVECRVLAGGQLDEQAGINVPDVDLSISSPTDKDLEDLRFGLQQEVDYVALSFVRAAGDINCLKDAVEQETGLRESVPVVAKIERPEAVRNLREILLAADGVMVARGDLGIEMPTEAVPAAQKQIIRSANRLGVPVITATQMLESMVDSPRPTRAEASDVANAILDGTDAVMLSGETSIGRYPVQTVRMMDKIARHIEQYLREQDAAVPEVEEVHNRAEHALANAACMIARRLEAAGIVPFTQTGSTARYVSQRRPSAPIYALTPDESTYRRLALLWAVRPVKLEMFETTDEMVQQGTRRLRQIGLVAAGDTIVYIAGASTITPGGTDMLKIHRFEE